MTALSVYPSTDLKYVSRLANNAERVPTRISSISTRSVYGHTWGHFKGKTIKFSSLLACTEDLTLEFHNVAVKSGNCSRGSSGDAVGGSDEESEEEPPNLLTIDLDVSELTAGLPRGWRWPEMEEWIDERERCKWLYNEFPAEDLVVLGLSSFPIRAFGLILLREHAYSSTGPMAYWRRLGYCEWWKTNLLDDQLLQPGVSLKPRVIETLETKYGPCLRALSDDWTEAEGLFG